LISIPKSARPRIQFPAKNIFGPIASISGQRRERRVGEVFSSSWKNSELEKGVSGKIFIFLFFSSEKKFISRPTLDRNITALSDKCH
jgi:hypothetical protein